MSELEGYRKDIDRIDKELLALWEERTRITDAIGRYKREQGIPVRDTAREAALLEEKKALVSDPGMGEDAVRLYETILSISRDRQQRLAAGGEREKNIVLIGMMGCGKTTIGKLLAEKLDKVLVDTDDVIEQREGCTIPEIFATKGEGYFRELELAVSEELAQKNGLIIACGGGLPLRPDCIGPLKRSGQVVWLCRDPGESYDGLDVSGRPLAQQGKEAFLARFEQRAPIYEEWADVIVSEFSDPAATLDAVLEGSK